MLINNENKKDLVFECKQFSGAFLTLMNILSLSQQKK